jgi:hypothetical protein
MEMGAQLYGSSLSPSPSPSPAPSVPLPLVLSSPTNIAIFLLPLSCASETPWINPLFKRIIIKKI